MTGLSSMEISMGLRYTVFFFFFFFLGLGEHRRILTVSHLPSSP